MGLMLIAGGGAVQQASGWVQDPDIQFTKGIPGVYDLDDDVGSPSAALIYGIDSGALPSGVTMEGAKKNLVTYDGIGDLDAGTSVTFYYETGSAQADWESRVSGAGVVWFHDFRSDAEVDNFRWTPGYSGGNDPLAVGSALAPLTRRNTEDGVTGGGCLEILRPAGSSDGSQWWRPFSPIVGSGNGKGTDDPGANGSLAAQSYAPTDGGSQIYNWHSSASRPGWYGHASYFSGNTFDGNEFYLQFRVKADPRRTTAGNTLVGKLFYLTTTRFSLTTQEIVTYSGAFTTPGGPNYHRMYAVNFNPIEDSDSLGRPGQQVGSDLADYGSGLYCDINSQPGYCWSYSGGWDTLMYRLVPGRSGVQETLIQVYAAHEGETSFTKIWDMVYQTGFEASLPFGWNAMLCAVYNNGQANSEFWHRYDQIIFSTQFIPCPQV